MEKTDKEIGKKEVQRESEKAREKDRRVYDREEKEHRTGNCAREKKRKR